MNCPDRKVLLAFRTGELSEAVAEEVISHVSVCADCQTTLHVLGNADDTLVARLRSPAVDDPYKDEPQRAELMARARVIVNSGAASLSDQPSTETAAPAALGRLGEYELLAKLGEGGMGAVYKARQTRLKKIVALKVLPKERTANPRAVTRFEREMEAIGQLSHPNIVQAYDARDIDGTTVLVMEYVDGEDLAQVRQRVKTLRIPDACEVVRQVALGLQYAHEHGLVHRDIKPSNLMLTSLPSHTGRGAGGEGIVKILDLGLALLGANPPADGELTAAGSAVGTADYIAPEQVSDAHSVDIRADIYSLGCTLYKLLTGRAPFIGPQYKTQAEKLVGHLKETPPPVQRLRSDVPAGLAAVIERMMAKSPDDRFATPVEVAAAVAPFAAGCDLGQLSAEAADLAGDAGDRSLTVTKPLASSADVGTNGGSKSQPAVVPRGLRRLREKVGTMRGIAIVGGLFLVILLGTLLTLTTRKGTLVIEYDDPNVQVAVKQGGEVVDVIDARSGWKLSLKPGRYELAPQGGTERFELDQDSITVHRGDVVTVKVTLKRALPIPDLKSQISGLKSPVPPHAVAPFDAKTARQHQEAWAKCLGVPVEITNSIGMKLVFIPPGEFEMGSPTELIEEELKAHGDGGWYNARVLSEVPRHKVRITRPFYFGIYDVTQEEYQRVMGRNVSFFTATGNGKEKVGGLDTRRFPVEQVSREDAVEFCDRLSEMPEEKAAARRYRIPSEAQWEYSCRAGSEAKWHCGNQEASLADYAWFRDNASGRTHEVGQRKANPWGLFDMHGNVWQWCNDLYDQAYYGTSPADDPRGPLAGVYHVARGGGWIDAAWYCRSAYRSITERGTRSEIVGFRACLTLADTAAEPAKMSRTDDSSQPSGGSAANKPSPTVAPFDAKKAKEHQEAWARHLGLPAELTNSIGMKLVLIPPGEFMMGSPDSDTEAAGEEKPQHRVRISQLFYLGKYLVTQEEYQRVAGANPSEFAATGSQKDKVAGQDTERFPVENVSWVGAVGFCRKLADMSEENTAGRTYRLPSEAQWEYACRAGNTGCYGFSSGSNAIAKERDENALSHYAWFRNNWAAHTQMVGAARPNAWGLFDMHGNVWEWCQDWFDKNYYANSPADDPPGPAGGSFRMHRGGCIICTAWQARSAARHYNSPEDHSYFVGFRVSLVVPDAAAERAKMSGGNGAAGLSGASPAVPSNNDQQRTRLPVVGSFVGADGNWKLPPGAPPPAVAPFDAKKAKEHQDGWAKHLGVPVELTNSIGMKLLLIPPGEFQMGSPKELIEEELKAFAGDQWRPPRLPGEGPIHRVRVTRPFYLGMYHATQEEYDRVMGYNPSWFSATGSGKDNLGGRDTKRFPVECVAWDDAVEFCRKLSNLPEEKSARHTYHLPTEAQWEYACRAGSTGRYSFTLGRNATSKKQDENALSDYGWFNSNSDGRTHAVGEKLPSAWGLYDMHGNVWQWCQDWYDREYYANAPTDDPGGPPRRLHRVDRGGTWHDPAGDSRSAYRTFNEPGGGRFYDQGFRVVLLLTDNSSEPSQPPLAAPSGKDATTAKSEIPNLKSQIPSHPPATVPADAAKATKHQEN